MRIIAGQWRGRTLNAPPGATTRPTADRTREALFSMLTSRLGSFEELRVVDVFAGTGALGLEALSRGAGHASFIDHDRLSITAIKANIAKLDAKETEVLQLPVSAVIKARTPCDILFFDPPYGTGGAGALLEKMTRLGWATATAWAAIETGAQEITTARGWKVDAERIYGKARLTVLSRLPEVQES